MKTTISVLRTLTVFTALLIISFAHDCTAGVSKVQYSAVGQTSWYGGKFHGRKTASGAIFNKNMHSAAHRSLPMLSLVKVTLLASHKSVIVIINDRGPRSKRAMLDLSEQTARELGFKNQGLAQIKLELLPEASKMLLTMAKSKNPQAVCNYFAKNSHLFKNKLKS